MHFLKFLSDAQRRLREDENSNVEMDQTLDDTCVRVEYRLLCSGMLYPGHFLGDWDHSDAARILMRVPFELLVSSSPLDDYPQELALRFIASHASQTEDGSPLLHYPDAEIAADIASFLTLFCRRLITVSIKTREQYQSRCVPPILSDFPVPTLRTIRFSHWKARPLEFAYGMDGIKVKSNHPPPLPVDVGQLIGTFFQIPKMPFPSAIVRAARLYAAALERIETQWETSYQLLISASETLAGAVLKGWEPDIPAKLNSKSALISYATKKENLNREVAERLALEASKDNPWSSRKFSKFLLDHVDRLGLQQKDTLFPVPQELCPRSEEIDKALKEIYRTRSGATHEGFSYPATAAIGLSPLVPANVLSALLTKKDHFPPVAWFERVVNSAICGYLTSLTEAGLKKDNFEIRKKGGENESSST